MFTRGLQNIQGKSKEFLIRHAQTTRRAKNTSSYELTCPLTFADLKKVQSSISLNYNIFTNNCQIVAADIIAKILNNKYTVISNEDDD